MTSLRPTRTRQVSINYGMSKDVYKGYEPRRSTRNTPPKQHNYAEGGNGGGEGSPGSGSSGGSGKRQRNKDSITNETPTKKGKVGKSRMSTSSEEAAEESDADWSIDVEFGGSSRGGKKAESNGSKSKGKKSIDAKKDKGVEDVVFLGVEVLHTALEAGTLKDGDFVNLPTEIHHNIIQNLSDKDVISYSKLCKTLQSVVGDNIWQERFKGTFDMPNFDGDQVEVLAKKYKFRMGILNKPAGMVLLYQGGSGVYIHELTGLGTTQLMHLEMLKSLIIDSDVRMLVDVDGNSSIVALNQDRMREFCEPRSEDGRYCDIIETVFDICIGFDNRGTMIGRSQRAFVLVIYLCLAHIALKFNTAKTFRRFNESQKMMYVEHQHNTIFQGKYKRDLNIRWLVHAVNFWKLQLTVNHEGILVSDFKNLPANQLPQPWLGKLQTGTQKLGKHWKGAYLHLSIPILAELRDGMDDIVYIDELDGSETFQDFAFFFDDGKFPASSWPVQFEHVLECNPFRATKEYAEPPVKIEHFYGVTRGYNTTDECYVFGGMHALPSQHQIPGFQRMAMIKFVPDVGGGYSSAWAYEGCVLPGGRIIVGQWWSIENGQALNNSGPFILWNIDEACAALDGELALLFYKSLYDLANWI